MEHPCVGRSATQGQRTPKFSDNSCCKNADPEEVVRKVHVINTIMIECSAQKHNHISKEQGALRDNTPAGSRHTRAGA